MAGLSLSDLDRRTGEQLLAAICAEPNDDGLRLIYADWLDDTGDADRAEFIRVQLQLATLAGMGRAPEPEWIDPLVSRELELWVHSPEWFAPLKDVLRLVQIGDDHPDEMTVLNFSIDGGTYAVVRRGFASEFHVPADWWAGHGEAVVRSHPVERVKFTDRRPHQGVGGSDRWFWYDDRRAESALTFGSPYIPEAILDVMIKRSGARLDYRNSWSNLTSAEMAWDVLSDACLKWARGSDD